jgi:KaiC/GvpD/RAD55 family RecA-like ATPase
MQAATADKVTTGVPGLDDILGGGLPRGGVYLEFHGRLTGVPTFVGGTEGLIAERP